MAELATSINLDPDTGSILVVRLKALGDIALTVPLLNSLRRSFPGARIDKYIEHLFPGSSIHTAD